MVAAALIGPSSVHGEEREGEGGCRVLPLPPHPDDRTLEGHARTILHLLETDATFSSRCPAWSDALLENLESSNRMGSWQRSRTLCQAMDRRGVSRRTPESVLACVDPLLAEGDLDEASRQIDQALDALGGDREGALRLLRAVVALMENRMRPGLAAHYLGKAQELRPDDEDLALRRLERLLEAGDEAGSARQWAILRGRFGDRPTVLRRVILTAMALDARDLAQQAASALLECPSMGMEDLDVLVALGARHGDAAMLRRVADRWVRRPGTPAERHSRSLEVVSVLERQGQSGLAADVLAQAIALWGRRDPAVLCRLGAIRAAAGARESARSAFQAAIDLSQGDPAVVLEAARLALRAGDASWAGEVMEREQRRIEAPTGDWWWILAQVRLALGNRQGAEAAWERAAADSREPARAWVAIGEERLREPGGALVAEWAFRKALDCRPSGETLGSALVGLVESLVVQAKDIGEFLRPLQEAVRGGQVAPDGLARIENLAARVPDRSPLRLLGLEAGVRRDPNRPDRWFRLARGCLQVSDLPRAFEAFSEAVRRSSDRRSALAEAVSALIQAGALSEAIRLSESFGTAASTGSGVARALTTACLAIQDVPCVARFATSLLKGPVDLDLDYLDLARRLGEMDLRDLSWKATDVAERVLPRDRAWEAILLGAELAATWRMDAEYQRRIHRLPEGRSLPEAAALKLARRLLDAGRPVLAIPWLLRAMGGTDEGVRGDAIASILEVAGRLGNEAALGRAADEARGFRWPDSAIWLRAVKGLLRAGLDTLAVDLWRTGKGGLAHREGLPPWPPGTEPQGWGREESIRWVQESCRRPGLIGDRDCLRAADWLERQARGDEAIQWLRQRARTGIAGEGLRVELVLRLLRIGQFSEGEETVADLVNGPLQEGSSLERLGRGMREAGLGRSWLALLETFSPRSPEAAEAATLERVRTALFLGDVVRAEAALAAGRDGLRNSGEAAWTVWREGGCLQRAAEVFLSTILGGGGSAGSQTFRRGVEDVVSLGWGNRLMSLGQVEPRETGSRDEETLARVGKALVLAGEWQRGLDVLSHLGPRTLDDEGRFLWFRALWASGRKAEARKVLISWWGEGGAGSRGEEKNPDPLAGTGAALGFLLSEGDQEDALALVKSWKGPQWTLPGIGDVRMVRNRIEWALGQGNWEDFMTWIAPAEGAFGEGVLRVQEAARSGGLEGAVTFLDRTRGRLAWDLGLLARSLRGDPDEVLEALARSRIEEIGDNGITAEGAAWAFLMGGRWELAVRWARKAASRSGTPTARMITLLVSASTLAGQPAVREALALADDGFEDPVARLAVRALIRKWTMDDEGEATELAMRWRRVPRDWEAAKEAMEAALRAEDDRIRQEVETRWIRGAEDPIQARIELAKLYRKYWKGEELAKVLEPLQEVRPGEAFPVLEGIRGWLMAGRPELAREVADRWVTRFPDPSQAAQGVVDIAAQMLDPSLVERWLPAALEGPRGPEGGRAVLSAAMALARTGRPDRAREVLGTWMARVPDTLGWRVAVARRVLADPEVPLEAVPWISRQDIVREEDGGPLPLEGLLACDEAQDFSGIPACVARWGLGTATDGTLLMLATRALAAGRWRHAREWILAADRLSGQSRSVRLQVARMLVSFLGDPEGWSREARRELGALALAWFPSGVREWRTDSQQAVRAHLEEMAHGVDAGSQEYRKALAADPSSASMRNNLAYLISLAGGDLEEAIRQARMALVLSPAGLPWYLETEAWARFLRGETQGALRMQRRALRHWTEDGSDGWSEGLWHLGRMLEKAGRLQEAREAWKRASVWAPPGDWHGIRSLRRWRETR